MKKQFTFLLLVFGLSVLAFDRKRSPEKYILQHEKDIATEQAGPHNGGGHTVSYPFFEGAEGFGMAFRKRVLLPGSAIGYHLQKEDEVYYILDGEGVMQMNNDSFRVKAGDAVLTRPGSSHGLRPEGNKALTVLIAYQLPGLQGK